MIFETDGIGIIGTRRRNANRDWDLIEEAFFEIYTNGDFIISGGCPQGGDRFAQLIAERHCIPIIIFYPNWKKFNKGAGIKRNTLIAKFSTKALIACVASDRLGGTEDTIKKYERMYKKKAILV